MSLKQWRRRDVLERLEKREMTAGQAATALGLSKRHVKRLRKAVRRYGWEALVHGNTGRAPPNRVPAKVRKVVAKLMKTKYQGFNDYHFTQKLVEKEKVEVTRRTVQRILRAAGIGPARARRPPKHRRRRDRKPQAGLMLLWDGSRHDWLEGRGPMLTLVAAIDDATGEVLPGAHFVDQECAAAYLKVLRAIVEEKGIPLSAYGDQHSALKRNDDFWTLEEELRGKQDSTHVGRALEALGIERIDALSPQAKGRVERMWGTFQDRLVSELRLSGARTVAEADDVLARYVVDHNRRFTVPAQDVTPAWRKLPSAFDLDRICSFHYEATVLNDNTVRLSGVVIDIPSGPGRRSYAKARVEVRQLLDGSWRVYLGDTLIATKVRTDLKELRAFRRRKRSAASRAFRHGVKALTGSNG